MHAMQSKSALARRELERELDMTLAGSFPASDPPFWTLGVTSVDDEADAAFVMPQPAATDVVIGDRSKFGRLLSTLGQAIAMMAALPFAILIVGLPVVALLRGLATAVSWLTGGR